MASVSLLAQITLLVISSAFILGLIIVNIILYIKLGKIPPRQRNARMVIIVIIPLSWIGLNFSTALYPKIVDYLAPLPLYGILWIELVGLIFCLMGLIISLAGFLTMGLSFRMGIPPKEAEPAPLITSGIFNYIRNPGFLGLDLAVLGTFFLAPTAAYAMLTLACLVVYHQQVLNEEEYLVTIYGQTYKDYMQTTGRYLPKIRK